MDSEDDSLTLHDDTVYDNAYDTDDNVYDVSLLRPWPDGIG